MSDRKVLAVTSAFVAAITAVALLGSVRPAEASWETCLEGQTCLFDGYTGGRVTFTLQCGSWIPDYVPYLKSGRTHAHAVSLYDHAGNVVDYIEPWNGRMLKEEATNYVSRAYVHC